MRNYNYREIGSREKRMLESTNAALVDNFNKVSNWIQENTPHLNGKYLCEHNTYYWVALVVEDGKAYLEEGSHGHGFSTALSATETATFNRGSEQRRPEAFEGVQFFRNGRLEYFLSQWECRIKPRILEDSRTQGYVYNNKFEA